MIIAADFTLDSTSPFDEIRVPGHFWGARRIRIFEKSAPSHEYYLAGTSTPASTERSLHTLGQVHEFEKRVYAPNELLCYGALDSGTATFTMEGEI